MANTTNFGWETPDDTDLVKDGAAAMRTLGNSIDASFVDLKGGTTGQILSKNSNTDLDYVWINNDQGDITGVTAGTGLTGGGTSGAVTVALSVPVVETSGGTNQTTYATGDLLYASAANTLTKRTIGSSGQVLTVSGGLPTWATPSSGGMTLLDSGSLSGASVTTATISGSYTNLEVYLYSQDLATANENIRMRFNGDSNTRYATNSAAQSTTTTFSVNYIEIASDTSDVNPYGIIQIIIPLYSVTDFYKTAIIDFVTGVSTSSFVSARRIGAYNQTGAITSMTFFPGAGNWGGGSYRVYGVK